MILKPKKIVCHCFHFFPPKYVCWLHVYLQLLYLLLGSIPDRSVTCFFVLPTVFVLKSILSVLSIATPVFFLFPFAWNPFFRSFTFSLYLSLDLRCSFVGSIYVGFCEVLCVSFKSGVSVCYSPLTSLCTNPAHLQC